MNNPLVSILITAYNRETYIAEAISSVLNSNFKNFELIIIDDCSEDGTYEIAQTFAQQDRRVLVYRNERNLGQFKNRNKAASYAKGEYLKYVDSDDMIAPDALKMMVQAIQSSPTAGIGLVCNRKDLFKKIAKPFVHLDSYTAFLWHYYNGGILFPGPTGCIFRKDLFLRAGGFPLDLGINGDIYLNMKLASQSSVVLYPGHIVFWRKHEGQVDVLQSDYLKMHKERFLINRRVLAEDNPFVGRKHLKQTQLSCKVLFMRGTVRNLLLKGKFFSFWNIMRDTNVSLFELPKVLIPLRLFNPLRNEQAML